MDISIEGPFGNQILVEPIQHKQPLGQSPKCEYGTAVAVGDEVMKVKKGDIIAFTKWGVNELIIQDGTPEGKKYYFVPEDSRFVLARLRMSQQLAA